MSHPWCLGCYSGFLAIPGVWNAIWNSWVVPLIHAHLENHHPELSFSWQTDHPASWIRGWQLGAMGNRAEAMRFFHALSLGCVPVIVGRAQGPAPEITASSRCQAEVGGPYSTVPLPFAEVGACLLGF